MMTWTWVIEKPYILLLFAAVGTYLIAGFLYISVYQENVDPKIIPQMSNSFHQKDIQKTFLINYVNPVHYIYYRVNLKTVRFDTCAYTNCELTVNRSLLRESDAVIFQGRANRNKDWFSRPPGQVWIFGEHEAPTNYDSFNTEWKRGKWRSSFNWTMTYDQDNTDIFLPYGELKEVPFPEERDFEAIYRNKTGEVLIVTSHCKTKSRRMEYIRELQKYIKVDVKGACGSPWRCGRKNKHDDCFQILNKYKFYLAFGNALCRGYFTEKFYENFKYDTILVTRGGLYGQAEQLFPRNISISTDDFSSAKELANFLKVLSKSPKRYIEMLKNKNKYYFPGFKSLYQRALCDICERLNNKENYRKQIPDIEKWAFGTKPCREVTDITNVNHRRLITSVSNYS